MCVFESYDVVTFIKDVVTSVVYTTEYQSAKAQTEYNNQWFFLLRCNPSTQQE